MKPELLPCPFCGGGTRIVAPLGHGNIRSVECHGNAHCGASGPWGSDTEKAIAAWNTRAAPATDGVLVEVEAALKEYLGKQCGMVLQKHALTGLSAMQADIAAREQAARDKALDEAAAVCIEQREAYLSPEYATGQPLSSIMERMACTTCADAILALKEQHNG